MTQIVHSRPFPFFSFFVLTTMIQTRQLVNNKVMYIPRYRGDCMYNKS